MSDRRHNDDRVAAADGPRKISLEERLEALESVARLLEWPLARSRDERLCWELTRIIDGVLTNVARGRGALDIAIGECLEALAVGDRVFEVGGYCNVPDYARERHGIPASTAVKLMRFSRELRKRPLLGAAVREGTVSVSQAEAVLPVAVGDAEQLWVARARDWTVRRLVEAVRKCRASRDEAAGDDASASADVGAVLAESTADVDAALKTGGHANATALYPDVNGGEEWTRVIIDLPPGGQEVIDKGTLLARQALERPGAPKWQVIRSVLDEFFGSGAGAEVDRLPPLAACRNEPPVDAGSLGILGEALDDHCAYWAEVVRVPNIEAPEDDARLMHDPEVIDRKLCRHVKSLRRWDLLCGQLALISKTMRCWSFAGFASFEHYCFERLGMALRTVEQRIALEQRLHELPALRTAMDEGKVSYEQARLIAAHADRTTVDVRIEQAQRMTSIAFRRRLEADEEAQMSARGKFKAVVPRSVAEDLESAFGTVRTRSSTPLTRGECLVALYAHFIGVWEPLLERRMTVQRKALLRDGYRCQVPGCSRTANHAHHIIRRSQGGEDELPNLISVCAAHHLRGIHGGRIRVTGTAPDQLVWTPDGALAEIEGRWSGVRAAA